jgi:signal transduction histidine kinase
VKVDRFIVDDLERGQATPPELEPGASRLQFDFSVLNLAGGAKPRLRYRLDGLDTAWTDAGSRRQVVYTNLAPGSYTFRVIDDRESDAVSHGAALMFTLKPTFFQRRSSYVFFAVVLGLVVTVAWRLRLRRVHRQFELILAERARMGREIHDTLLQSVVAIALELDDLAEQVDASAAPLKGQFYRLRDQVERYTREARQAILKLRSPSLEANDLAAALRRAGELATQHLSVAFRFDVSGTPRRLDAELEEQLLRIGQEAVSNAVKHAAAHTIDVTLQYAEHMVTLTVTDDGRGFDPDHINGAAAAEHWGIPTMR